MKRRKPGDRRDEIGGLLQQFSAASDDLGRAFGSRHGMHHTSARAIVELMKAAEGGAPMTAGQLGAALDLTPGSVTALVDRMVVAGHVRREPDPTDRRRVLLTVEPAAVQLGHEFFRPLAEDLNVMMRRYSDDDLRLIAQFLGRSIDVIRNHLARLHSLPTAGRDQSGP